MHGVARRRLRGRNDVRDLQVALGRRRWADARSGRRARRGMRHGRLSSRRRRPRHRVRGARDHPHGDLASISDEHAFEHVSTTGVDGTGSSSNRSAPYSTGCAFSACIALTTPAVSALSSLEQLHRLEDAEHLARDDGVPHVDERRRPRVRSAVEDSDHRRLDARDAVRRRSEREHRLGRLDARANLNRNRRKRLVGATHRNAHALVLDLDLPTPDSCTIFTSSRMRSPRSASASSAMSTESREFRPRMTLSSSSASLPNIAMRTSSSSLAARPSACSRTSSVVTGSSMCCPGGDRSSTARSTVGSIASGVSP